MRKVTTQIYHRGLFAGILALLYTSLASASGANEIPIVDAAKGTAGIGFGFRFGTSPYRNINNLSSVDNDNSHDLLPLYLYEGDVFFAHGSSAGLHLFENDAFSLDLLGRYRFDRLESDADSYYQGINDREQSFDAGASFTLKQTWGQLSFTVLEDISDKHNGQELDVTYRLVEKSGRWMFSPYISYIYQDSDILDYYYGVDASEAKIDRQEYHASGDAFWRAGLNTSYQWSKRMLIFANMAFESVPESANDSPLVDESNLYSATAGFAYLFGSTNDTNYRVRASRPSSSGEWSWRLNYGYTTESTFNKVHSGDFFRNDDIDTHLAGFTLGKLLQNGRKIDYWGRFSLNRRFENDFQSDFWEYNAYVMAMGHSYSSYTGKEILRYGFGFGFSYSEKVPYVEFEKQQQRERNTSHFLNYLEAQVDTPLSAIFGDGASDSCYTGLTLVHRSGIFATADLVGNVDGGSNVLTVHLECKQ